MFLTKALLLYLRREVVPHTWEVFLNTEIYLCVSLNFYLENCQKKSYTYKGGVFFLNAFKLYRNDDH